MGIISSAISQAFPPKAEWGPDDIPDLTGRVAVVTGGYAGIGAHTVKGLLARNAKVYVAGRDEGKAAKTIADLKSQTGNEAIFLNVDLGSLKSVKAAAEELASKEHAVHMLFNNAGVMAPPINKLTSDGYDLQWGTNVLGHFYFTRQLLPLLLAGAASSPDGKARVVNTSSSASEMGAINFAAFRDGPARKNLGTWKLYSQSKIGNVLFSNELARRYGSDGIVSTAVNPGNLKSELQRHLSKLEAFFIYKFVYPTHFGALTQLYAGTSAAGLDMNGKYLWPWAREGSMPGPTKDAKLGEEVWAWCEEQVKDL